jgi:hypothetical protein
MNSDWGLGIGDWGLGNPQSPIPNPQSPIFRFLNHNLLFFKKINYFNILSNNQI